MEALETMGINLTVVIPVKDALSHFNNGLASILSHTLADKLEIVLVDDYSLEDTVNYIHAFQELCTLGQIPQLRSSGSLEVVSIRNDHHSWTNASWNTGVKQARGEYIAVINSDITVSEGWDSYLMETLEESVIACPYLECGKKLDALIEKIDPEMIQGSCFMFKRCDRDRLFPIPQELLHWYGDRILADRAKEGSGVGFNEKSIIRHLVTQSGRLIERGLYLDTVRADLKAYEKLTGKKEDLVWEQIKPF